MSPKERLVSAESQDVKRIASAKENTFAVHREGAKRLIDRRRLVATGLTAPVVLTLGSRSAQAQSHGGSHMSSIAGATKKK